MNAPKWLRPLAVVALLWNLMGFAAFVADLMITPEAVARMDAAQRALYESRPAWSVIATGFAVVGGALGSLLLLLRRRLALPLFAASLLGVLLQDAGMLMMARDLLSPAALGLQGLVLVVAAALFMLARRGAREGWLH